MPWERPQEGKRPCHIRFVIFPAAGVAGGGVTIKSMSDTGSSGNRPSLGAMLGSSAGKAFRKLRGNPGQSQETPSIGAMLGRGAGTAFRNLRGERGRQTQPPSPGTTPGSGGSRVPGPQAQPPSLGATLGSGAGTAFGKLRGAPGRNKRVYRGFRSGVSVFWQTAKGTLRVLFLELSGVMFLCFTVIIVSAFIREYRKYATHQVGLNRVVLAGVISAMFFYFGLSSFWRARRKQLKG